MSMSNQEILDHTARYLFDRIQNKGGRLVKGWYNKNTGDSRDRCVLGTLADDNCTGVFEISRSACNKLNGYNSIYMPSGWDFPEIAQIIMHWNDHLSQLPIDVNDASMMVKNLALSFGLNLDVWNNLLDNDKNQKDQTKDEHQHEEDTECSLDVV